MNIDPQLASQAWSIAGRIVWTAEDWQTFYEHITKAFIVISARYAKEQIDKHERESKVVAK